MIESLSQTLIIATHDLEILPRFNKIIVMNDGEIIENDSYQELMQHDGYLKSNRNEWKRNEIFNIYQNPETLNFVSGFCYILVVDD